LSKRRSWAIRAEIVHFRERARRKFKRKISVYAFVLSLAMIILIGALLLLLFERKTNPEINNYWESLWLLMVTMTTVGYGDSVPITAGGRIVAIASMIFGVGVISALITTLASSRLKKVGQKMKGLGVNVKSVDHFVICGWNSRGPHVIKRLKAALKTEHRDLVLLCDLDECPVDDEFLFFVKGSPVNKEDISKTNVEKARSVVILADMSSAGSDGEVDAKTVLTALTIKSINPDIRLTAEVLELDNYEHLKLAGVDQVLDSDVLVGDLLARSTVNYGLIDLIMRMLDQEARGIMQRLPVSEEMTGMDAEGIREMVNKERAAHVLGVQTPKGIVPLDEKYEPAVGDMLLVLSDIKPQESD